VVAFLHFATAVWSFPVGVDSFDKWQLKFHISNIAGIVESVRLSYVDASFNLFSPQIASYSPARAGDMQPVIN